MGYDCADHTGCKSAAARCMISTAAAGGSRTRRLATKLNFKPAAISQKPRRNQFDRDPGYQHDCGPDSSRPSDLQRPNNYRAQMAIAIATASWTAITMPVLRYRSRVLQCGHQIRLGPNDVKTGQTPISFSQLGQCLPSLMDAPLSPPPAPPAPVVSNLTERKGLGKRANENATSLEGRRLVG